MGYHVNLASVNFVTQFSTPNKIMPEGNKIWVLGDGVDSNYRYSPGFRDLQPIIS
jgi:hypothetical protein